MLLKVIRLSFIYQCLIFMAITPFFSGCELSKDVEVPLPPYESKLVIECYLEAGKPYRMAVTETSSYFSEPQLPDVRDATVQIAINGKTETLRYHYVSDTVNRKVYNYASTALVPDIVHAVCSVEVEDTLGRKITGEARFMPVVPIKEVSWEFDEDSAAYVLMRFDDAADTENYYRFQVHRNSPSTNAETDYIVDDSFTNGKEVTLGTGYDFLKGDTVYVTLYHLEKRYYDFMQSVENAANANGNPFAQPATIKSTVQGGIGVFATLVYDRKKMVIE